MPILMSDLVAELRVDLDERAAAVWDDADLRRWLSIGIQRTRGVLKGVRHDWTTKKLLSTDGVVTIHGSSYDTASFQIISGTSTYTLPADLVEVRLIQPINQSDIDDGIRFLPKDLTSSDFQSSLLLTNETQGTPATYYYELIGLNTLIIAPTPQHTLDIALYYAYMTSVYASGDTISDLPDWGFPLVKTYARYLALRSINHPDAQGAMVEYRTEVNDVKTIASPRQSQEPLFATGVFDWDEYDVDVWI